MMTSTNLWRYDAVALSGLLDAGTVTPVELLDLFLARCERLNPVLNAFIHVDRAGAMRAAVAAAARQGRGERLGPLDGIPVAVKDNLFVAGMPASWGSLLFRGHFPKDDDLCVERLRTAGAVLIGKTTTPEFALSGRTESRIAGMTRNPWDPALTPGGSSGGAVAAVASGMVPLALGTDAGGSTRIPASYTGLVGLRPSNGRVPRRYGFPSMANDFQTIGTLTRTVRDQALLYGALAGPDTRDPTSSRLPPTSAAPSGRKLRVGWFTAIGHKHADNAVAGSVGAALQMLAEQNCEIEPCTPPFDLTALRDIWGTLTAVGAARVATRFPDRWQDETTTSVAAAVESGLAIPATAYVEALDRLALLRAGVSASWGDFDALAMPTAPAPAWAAEEEHPAEIGGRPGKAATQGMFCGWVNAVGYPGISIPVAPHPDGRPIGLQFVAPFGHETVLLDLARRLEQVLPWASRWPLLAERS